MRVFHGVAELERAVNTHLGYSDWHTINQDQINAFAQATGDHQWIHVDPEKAVHGPFGSTIAHGYLTMSLVPMLVGQVYEISGVQMGINYGADRLRFPSPVPVGSRIRAGVELTMVKPNAMGYQVATRVTIDRDGGDKPACVVDMLTVVVP
ncbi:MaoC family dehydratase [Rhodococcus sp. IEGM 1307]|uniref:MaoC family dehydratase n=1 Tax=Rhodococcus sp. IEGM 1307 TaxID=3047091 RepID=UPI0024B8095D|nr:MaoC family dehydratase [Rhodococcus sp. IEGM 1307]MDI9979514.1 MaoC family dehydratase [Rhodococcus sp. IEGM 1307]